MNFADLRTILKYVPQFRGKTFVTVVDGKVISSGNFGNLLLDLAVLRSLGIRVVFCFDATPQVEAMALERNLSLSNLHGGGAVDQATRDLAQEVCSRLTADLAGQCLKAGQRFAVTQIATVRPAGIVRGREQGFRGRVDAVDVKGLEDLLEKDFLPLVAPFGFERGGECLLLEAGEVGRTVAERMGAAKLIFACQSDPTLASLDNPRQFSIEEAAQLLESGLELSHPVRRKLWHARRACENGVPRVHLVDGEEDGAILAELFRSEGFGTMVYRDVYRSIRPAEPGDLEALISMMRHAVEDGQLVERTDDEMMRQLSSFFVVEVDGNIVGCAALHRYPEEGCGEVAALLVRATHISRGFGSALVRRLESEAKGAGLKRVFALSTQAPEFFMRLGGYVESTETGALPPARREKYARSERKSRIFWKEL